MSGRGRGWWKGAALLGLATVLFVAGGLGLLRPAEKPAPAEGVASLGLAPSGADLTARIAALQSRVRQVPGDFGSWAGLGLAYVEQARVGVDPAYYPKAQGVLERSLSINTDDNYAAAAGMAALAAARHDFAGALDWAQRGLAINRANATLYGALADAQIQLGHYPEAFEATQRMVDLAPTTASLARVSYVWELRGDIEQATANMTRALDDAATPADKGFARYYLGELAFNAGDATAALAQYQAGLAIAPAYAPLLEGKAKAEAALGQTDAAITDYTRLVERVPQPSYLVQLGELFESLGRKSDADAQYSLFETEATLFQSNGVTLDAEQALFFADHGDPAAALRAAEAGIATRGFLDMDDGYAWALHVNGRDAEALSWSKKALALGTRNALFHFHAGMIQLALGDTEPGRAELATALAINPHFSTRWAPPARQALDGGVMAP